jgi:hypothetical protein
VTPRLPLSLGGLLTRARIRAPFEGEITCQDRQRQGKDTGKGGEKTLVKTLTGKTSSLWPVGCISDQFPTRGTPTTSLRLARQVQSRDKSPPCTKSPVPTGVWAQTHGVSITTNACGGMNLHVMQVQQLAAMQAPRPTKSLNASLTGCAAITSPSSLALHTQTQPKALKHPVQCTQA